MRIMLLFGSFSNSGGTERVGSLIANGLSKAGHKIIATSISCDDKKPFFPLEKNIKLISLFKSSGRALYRAPVISYKLRKLILNEKVDVLIVIETMAVLFTLPAVAGISVKHICWEHFNFNNDLGKKGRRFARQLAARYCDSVVTLTERDKEYWIQGTKHKNQITAIPNPCPFPVQKNSSCDSKIVLAVGRLVHIKGYDLLLKAWLKVANEAPDWKLKIVGEGEERDSLTRFIIDNSLSDSVELVGKTNDVKKYYEQAEIFCLSSRFEGFPMVLLETLSFGLPVVSFDCDTGPAEILNETGSILIEPYDTNLLAAGLLKLMDDADLRKSISLKSKEKAKQYQPSKIIEEWVSLINRLH